MEAMDKPNEAPKRPGFLNVLCILSFIGTGLGIIMGIYHLATAGATQAAANLLGGMTDTATETLGETGGEIGEAMGSAFGNLMETAILMAKYAYVLAGIEVATNILCLLGVIWMWKLMKKGYYLYVVGQLAAIIAPVVLVGFGGFFGGVMILMAIFPIAFIVMYAANLKHMS